MFYNTEIYATKNDMKTEPREALRHIRTCIEPNVDTAMSTITRYDAGIAAKIAFQEGQSSPKIKQLEWDFYGTYYSAETPVIDYMITQENDFVENDSNCELWLNGFPISHGTLAEAKAAAQADFEKRVMGCLDL